MATVLVDDRTSGVEFGAVLVRPVLVVLTGFDEVPSPEQPARINAPAATMTTMSGVPRCLRVAIRMGFGWDLPQEPSTSVNGRRLTTRT